LVSLSKLPEEVKHFGSRAPKPGKSAMNTIDLPDLESLIAIGQEILDSRDWKTTLNKITLRVRSLLIFDNMVVYLKRGEDILDVIHARAIGRGKAKAADLSWGEDVANDIIAKKQTLIHEPEAATKEERLLHPYILGIPLISGDKSYGAFMLIRFGGPVFLPEQVSLAQYIARLLTFLVERQFVQNYEKLIDEQNNQLQLQKDFISTVSHELRNPLGFIKGYTTTLLREDAHWDEKTQREFLAIIDQETDHMQALIENLLDSSRLQAGILKMNLQQTHIDTLVKNILERESIHHPHLKTELNSQESIQPVRVDPGRIGQVIENLVSNAVKYAPGSPVCLVISQDDIHTTIMVKDEGQGIPVKYLPYIFERFFRIPGQNETLHGSGLGLFICKQIVRAHGGDIWAESPPNQGTTFHIDLPNQPPIAEERG
jgi:signal transduction histidine kinase